MTAESKVIGVEKEFLHKEARAISNKWHSACGAFYKASLAYAGGSSSRMGSIGFYNNERTVILHKIA